MSARRLFASLPVALAAMAAVASGVHALPVARSAASGPSVQTMIVGAGGRILALARTVTAGATDVAVARRSCAVAAGTPLAALAAERRAGGPGFALRDYARCGPSPANSGQLFVYSLAGETNHAQNGWEYKVNGVAGSAGAGDESGPQGNGRLLGSGEQVLWFWCQAGSGGCERSLQISASTAAIHRGHAITVSVTGMDNYGRAVPVAGAIVTLGSDFASTGSGGRATLIAPAGRGSYTLSATRNGLVPSFPETIVVR
jgi:hypothetical protein